MSPNYWDGINTTEDYDRAVAQADTDSRPPYVDFTKEPEPVNWLVPDWVQQGDIILLAGRAGGGKSTTAAELAVAATGGKNGSGWLGIQVPQIPTLYLDEEAGEDEIRRHFQRHGARDSRDLWVSSCQGFRLNDPQAVKRIEREINDKEIKLLVMDTATQVFGGVNENDSGEVSALFKPLFEFRAKYGLTTIVLHHLRKMNQQNQTEDLMDRVRGSTAFTTQPSAVWGQVPIHGGSAVDLSVLKRRGGGGKPTLRISYTEINGKATFTNMGHPEQSESELDRCVRFMADIIRRSTQEIWTTKEVKYLGTDYPERTVERAVSTMKQVGIIRTISRGKYICDSKIPPDEREMFDDDKNDG